MSEQDSVLNHPDVRDYTIPDPPDWPDNWRGDWSIQNTGDGWQATHPHDGFFPIDGKPMLWLTAEDAIRAILGDPTNCTMADGRRYGDVR